MNSENPSAIYENRIKVINDCKLDPDMEKNLEYFNAKVTHKQYGIGGECLHRGYYCPSKIYDIIVGNVSRGKITNHKPVNRSPSFTFGFDSQNKLVLVWRPYLCEIIYHQEQSEIGIAISDDMKIRSLSECHFCGGKIHSYSFCLLDPYRNRIVELDEENYTYSKDQVQVDWSRIAPVKNSLIKQHENYIFSVEDGYLTSYRVQDLAYNNRLFKVRTKRKI